MYISTAFKGALEDRDAQKLADYISSLTNQEAIVVVTDNYKGGHTHVVALKGETDENSRKGLNAWIWEEGGKVFRNKNERLL